MDELSMNLAIALGKMEAGSPEDFDDPRDYIGAVRYHAGQMALLFENKYVRRNAEVVFNAGVESDKTCKRFSGVFVGLEKEESSRRGIVTLKTKPSPRNENGIETVRTAPAYTFEGKQIVSRLLGGPKDANGNRPGESLINHKLLLYVDMEEMPNGNKVRVLSDFVDLGPAD
ncbi:hypothetical protein [Actinomyces vulturis]|uniref:hypothetical protein n=1 Tax=Actinomyces vulturis TaxID=1857645 RepID=UPI000829FA23|nr:hypothetical protein [Actinomyces vulturis]